jgi:aspartate/methionine/tyrosine aminotransferase
VRIPRQSPELPRSHEAPSKYAATYGDRRAGRKLVRVPAGGGPRWVRGEHGAIDHEVAVALKSSGVLTPGYRFGVAGHGRIRINFSQDRERLLIAAERIAKVLV